MARASESSYNTRLRQVALQVDNIIRGTVPDGQLDHETRFSLVDLLEKYATLIEPWARSVARYMIADVNRRNLKAWEQISSEMSKSLRTEILHAPTGMLYTGLMDEQVRLIKSLPLEAAKRVHVLTDEALTSSRRAESIQKDILATGKVTASRARLIARTEVSRTASNLTQARAMFAGSDGYIWRTSADADVRPTHQEQEGKYIRWSHPPKTDKGLDPYHAGCGPNCRCYPDPVLPDL